MMKKNIKSMGRSATFLKNEVLSVCSEDPMIICEVLVKMSETIQQLASKENNCDKDFKQKIQAMNYATALLTKTNIENL